jgi:hypothetical protein
VLLKHSATLEKGIPLVGVTVQETGKSPESASIRVAHPMKMGLFPKDFMDFVRECSEKRSKQGRFCLN